MQCNSDKLLAEKREGPQPVDGMKIAGYKSIGPLQEVELNRLNVLIGANGSGKSNFVNAFNMLRCIGESDHQFQNYVLEAGGASSLLHFGPQYTQKLTLSVSFEDQTNRYHVDLVPTDDQRLFPQSEWVSFRGDKEHHNFSVKTGSFSLAVGQDNYQGERREVVNFVRQRIQQWRVYHFHDTSKLSPAKSTADIHDNLYLHPQGKNLPSFLYMLKSARPDSYDIIVRNIRAVMPFFDDFVLEPFFEVPDKIRLRWRHQMSSDYLDVSALSDGGLRFILLTTLLMQPAELMPSVVLLDEPEIGLHPAAIRYLSEMIKHATIHAQMVVATQSSLLVDRLAPEDLLVTEQVNGATRLFRPNSQQLADFLEDYTLGQLWERNEFGGVP